MDLTVIALVAVSAVLHVAWNVRLKTAGDPLRTAVIGLAAGTAVVVPVGLIAWGLDGFPPLPTEAIVIGAASGVVEAGYFVLLSAAYRRGDLSVVYPIARGTAPLLAVAVGVGLLGEHLGVAGTLGVALLIAGFLALQRPWRVLRGRSGFDASVGFALGAGVAIAGYSALDRVGTRIIGPFEYAAIIWIVSTVALLAWVRFVARLPVLGPPDSHDTRNGAVGGLLTLGAYLLILVALSVAPLSGVAPLRESATVVAAAWGSVRLGEAADRGEAVRRVTASVALVAGALCLALGG